MSVLTYLSIQEGNMGGANRNPSPGLDSLIISLEVDVRNKGTAGPSYDV